MADVTIYHNPNCGTSRNVLAMIRAAGHAPQVVEYLKAGWTRTQLESLFAAMGVTPRQMLREKDAAAAGLDPAASDAAILDAMVAHPVLVQRPIVVTERGTVLARPAETLQGLL
jgi:arsenate reductase